MVAVNVLELLVEISDFMKTLFLRSWKSHFTMISSALQMVPSSDFVGSDIKQIFFSFSCY